MEIVDLLFDYFPKLLVSSDAAGRPHGLSQHETLFKSFSPVDTTFPCTLFHAFIQDLRFQQMLHETVMHNGILESIKHMPNLAFEPSTQFYC